MPLRPVNNPNTDKVIMTVLKSILPVDTALVSSTSVFIQKKYDMYLYLKELSEIALLLTSGPQEYEDAELSGFDGQMVINVDYYSCWDENPSTIDDKWQMIAEDIERVKSNAESNDRTEYGATNHTLSIARMTLGPYEDEYDRTFPDLVLLRRRLSIIYNLLPYGV